MRKFGRIGVLMGGLSSERDVSLKSGKAVACALKKSGIDAAAIDIRPVGRASRLSLVGQTSRLSNEPNLIKDYVLRKIRDAKVDIVFIALHGKFGEDGTIQGLLEENGIPYTGSGVSASRLAMDKVRSRELFQKAGLSVPNCVVLNSHSQKRGRHTCLSSDVCLPLRGKPHSVFALARPSDTMPARTKDASSRQVCLPLEFPIIVKPSSQGSSIGLSLVETEDKLKRAIDLAYKYDDTVLVEEYISGKEVTAAILNDKPLPVVHILPGRKFYDYNAKYKSNSTRYICPANIGRREYKRIQESGLIAHKCLGCKSFSRVDMILKEDGTPVVLEVNTIPGLTSKSLLPKAAKAAGISFEKLCLSIVSSRTGVPPVNVGETYAEKVKK